MFSALPPTPSGNSPSTGCLMATITVLLCLAILGALGWFMVQVLLEIRRAWGA